MSFKVGEEVVVILYTNNENWYERYGRIDSYNEHTGLYWVRNLFNPDLNEFFTDFELTELGQEKPFHTRKRT